MPVNRKESVGETEAVQESADEGETEVDEVLGTVINRRKSYDIYFQIGVVIS